MNGKLFDKPDYVSYHDKRIRWTIEKLLEIGARKIVEVGSHPWTMTAALIDNPHFEVCATISAEELIKWPDEIEVDRQKICLKNPSGKETTVMNYSANIERTLFGIEEIPDTVIACEIVEHLQRAPHLMFLNINRWLPVGGTLLITTPNGAQFSNPFRRKSPTPAYRSNSYERHSYVYTLNELTDLVTLCGFRVVEAGYWDVYKRFGPSAVYDVFSKIPLRYFKDKFKKTIYFVGEKDKEIRELERCPRVYDPRGDWEYIKKRT